MDERDGGAGHTPGHVPRIGGAADPGKTSVARALAAAHGPQAYVDYLLDDGGAGDGGD